LKKILLYLIRLDLIVTSASLLWLATLGLPKLAAAETAPSVEQTALSATESTSPSSNAQQPELLDPLIQDLSDANNESTAQVTSVSQLSDVQPTDWAFQAVQSLVERYGCIAGYPNSTFKGNRAATRYELAAALNACLDQISDKFATKEELATVKALQEEFKAELATLKGRVDGLEARTATLEAQQFSTTTKLFGQAIFGVTGRTDNRADLFIRDGVKETKDPGAGDVKMLSSLQLTTVTQFSDRSLLLIGLQAGSGSTSPRLTNNARLSFESNTDNKLILSDLSYRFLVGKKLAMIVGAEGVNMVSVFRGPNRVESAGSGPISAFAQRNPILNIGAGRAGVGLDWQFNRRASLQAVFSGNNFTSPVKQNGSLDNHTTAGIQLALTPIKPLDITLYYVNAYSPSGTLLTGVGDDQLVPFTSNLGGSPLSTNAVGATLTWKVSSRATLGGWVGYTNSHISGKSGEVETINWMAFLNLPDLFGKGNLGGLYVGQLPKIISSTLPIGENIPDLLNGGPGEPGGQPGTTTHVELFYRLRVTDNISITPGVMFIFQPGNTPDSDMITVGAVRTTFTF
jgi:Carbohydrate-selective porin, OprB family/S-layer homology domain